MARQTHNRISYIRKPMAEHSYLCLGMAAAALLLAVGGMGLSIKNQGNTPLGGISMCFSSLLFACVSLRYGWKSFQEEEKNYLLARIGTGVGAGLTILWLVIILIGFGR